MIKSLFIIVAIMLCQSRSDPIDELWKLWKEEFHKSYPSPEEEEYRFSLFKENWMTIYTHNNNTTYKYSLGQNQFMDLTVTEFLSVSAGLISDNFPECELSQQSTSKSRGKLSSSIDWRTKGAVTSVKNQGNCASGYSFATIGAYEFFDWNITKNQTGTTEYSAQQIVDCSISYGNKECSGGAIWYSLNYFKDKKIENLTTYPYTGKKASCKSDFSNHSITGYKKITNLDQLIHAVNIQPIIVGLNITKLMFYNDGIFDNCDNSTKPNQALLLVGYTDDYWILKNSWGIAWGDSGYLKVKRIPDDSYDPCGIANFAFYPELNLDLPILEEI